MPLIGGKVRCKIFFKTNIGPQVMVMPLWINSSANSAIQCGRAASSTKWKPVSPVWATMASILSHNCWQQQWVRTYRYNQDWCHKTNTCPNSSHAPGLVVPPTITPQSVHRVDDFYKKTDIFEWQATIIRRCWYLSDNCNVFFLWHHWCIE